MIFSIATQAVQSAYNAIKEIPILMTAVTDPVEASVVTDWKVSGTNVTGTSDLTPVAKQMELIKELVPEAKTVGVIYTTSEVNSEVQVNMAEEAAKELGLEGIKVGVTTVSDIPQAVASVIDKIDAMYAPIDNLIASSMPVLWNACADKKISIVSGVDTMVIDGEIATEGIDYYQLGYETGLMAAQVLEGKDPSTMPINTF
ncbi:MAG: ABC transporter substrate-binding protein [Turicibacter sp.]|nr:ABC transporter substrate-binding protein [Turicibacter sp.]